MKGRRGICKTQKKRGMKRKNKTASVRREEEWGRKKQRSKRTKEERGRGTQVGQVLLIDRREDSRKLKNPRKFKKCGERS